jgi:hypothetical protein
VAALFGLDPVAYLYMDNVERQWYEIALQRAIDHDTERRKAMVRAIGVSVGNVVAERLARMFR